MLVANSATSLWRHSGTFLLNTDIQTDIHTFISPPLFWFRLYHLAASVWWPYHQVRTWENPQTHTQTSWGLEAYNSLTSDDQTHTNAIHISNFVSNAAVHSLLDSRWTEQVANLFYPCPFPTRFSSLITNRWLTSGLKDTMSYSYMRMLFCHYTMYFS